MSIYLFDIDGNPIAFRRTWDDRYVFAVDGQCLGVQPWKGCDVVDVEGRYLGSVIGDRLVRRNDGHRPECDVAIPDPGLVVPTGTPGRPLDFPYAHAYQDVELHRVG
ncbi:hypothetical protein ACHAAC_04020 [Aeromicrobium sp. CF4.19]|uniref:hypothetical protein n=1 Tax=Aeromicrobium sp. CF4.19 TaxID=3373082 RepID=UPI003EE68D16